MRATWLLVFSALIGSSSSLLAQQWINPIVEIHTDAVSDQDAERLSGLASQVTNYLRSYQATDPSITLVPIVPINYKVDLTITESIGTDYLSDLRISVFRPIFEKDTESLILIASESGVPISYKPSQIYMSSDLGSIQDPFYARLHYYTGMALALYYDSMDTYGGDPFWKALQKLQAEYEPAWQTNTRTTLPSLSPRSILPEVFTQWGDHFRDLWFMYHLEALDAEGDPKRHINLTFILSELAKLNSENHLHTLFQLLRDTKTTEVANLYHAMPRSDQAKAQPYVLQLFPSVSPTSL